MGIFILKQIHKKSPTGINTFVNNLNILGYKYFNMYCTMLSWKSDNQTAKQLIQLYIY